MPLTIPNMTVRVERLTGVAADNADAGVFAHMQVLPPRALKRRR
jgi:hypothetical protein